MPMRTEEGWIRVCQDKCAFWIHDGNPKRPHALLTSGMHSTGYFNGPLVISDKQLLREAVSDLIDVVERDVDIGEIDRVVGPETGVAKLAEFISDEISRRRERSCAWASLAKMRSIHGKSMVFRDPGHTVLPGEMVLLCDDVLATGGSAGLTARATTNARGVAMSFVAALVNRSGFKYADGRRIISLIDRIMPAWFPEECPLCPEGSKPLLPKGEENWALLNAVY